jgi:hypothetical protein
MKRVITLLLLLGCSAANAEEMYVNDKLVVNVYEQPDQASAKVDTIETGDSAEVLDRTEGGFAHVHLANGREGYVRASYLTSAVPAIRRLKELEAGKPSAAPANNDAQTKELAKFKERNAALETELTALKNKPAPTQAVCPSVTDAAPAPRECPTQVVPPPAIVNGFSPWFASGLSFAGVIVGFALGYRMLASRIRKKYRGLKIY